MGNTYQITADEFIEICESIQNGYKLKEVESDEHIMSVTLIDEKTNKESIYNFLR